MKSFLAEFVCSGLKGLKISPSDFMCLKTSPSDLMWGRNFTKIIPKSSSIYFCERMPTSWKAYSWASKKIYKKSYLSVHAGMLGICKAFYLWIRNLSSCYKQFEMNKNCFLVECMLVNFWVYMDIIEEHNTSYGTNRTTRVWEDSVFGTKIDFEMESQFWTKKEGIARIRHKFDPVFGLTINREYR